MLCSRIRNVISRRMFSGWSGMQLAPPDPILGLTVAFEADTSPDKVNLGSGAYRTDDGQPYILKAVQEACQTITSQKWHHEYEGIGGKSRYCELIRDLILGEANPLTVSKRVATVQTISGTGALRVAAAFLKNFAPNKTIYMPNPTWANHAPIFTHAGLECKQYRYYKPGPSIIDSIAMCDDLQKAPDQSIVLLHACAHNPTGVDPDQYQWAEISKVMKIKGHIPLFDAAYQGFASGSFDADAYAIRHFISEGHLPLICQSFAKNFGLYGERAGGLHITCTDPKTAVAVTSQLKSIIRPMYSSPPVHGSRIVELILSNPLAKQHLFDECLVMSNRIKKMRRDLMHLIQNDRSVTRDWSHIGRQIGMFAYTGLNAAQVKKLKDDFHIYMTDDGRINVGALNFKNNAYVANAIIKVT